MRRRDWAGTVLVACLIALAGLLRNQGLLALLLIAAAVVSSGVILWDIRPTLRRWLRTMRSTLNERQMTVESTPTDSRTLATVEARPMGESDANLRALLTHGRSVSDRHLAGTMSPLMETAARKELLLWTRDVIGVLRQGDLATADRFEAASSHQERMAILADYLGVEET
jgi:hypothetical protein